MTSDQTGLLLGLAFIALLFLSLIVHTVARIWATCYLRDGNSTGQRRFSLNPWSYVDWVGTLLLPLFGVPFGWTKSPPINPFRFRFGLKMKTGRLLIALSGPAANLSLAILGTFTLAILGSLSLSPISLTTTLRIPLEHLVFINLSLVLFHMLPIPPLVGYHIVTILTSERFLSMWGKYRKFSPIVLAGFFIIPPKFFEIRLFDWPVAATYSLLGTVGNWFGG